MIIKFNKQNKTINGYIPTKTWLPSYVSVADPWHKILILIEWK